MPVQKNNSGNQDFTNNSDGWDLTGGTTRRKLTVTGSDITVTGSGTNTYTFPATSATLWGDDRIKITALASDQSNSTTTGTEVTGLTTTLDVGTYWIQVMIRYQSAATTTGVKFGVNHDGTSTLMATLRWGTTGTTATTNAPTQNVTGGEIMEHQSTRTKSTTAPNLGPSLSVDTANADMMCVIDVYLNVTASGNFELWHGSEVAAQSTVMAGTAFIIYKVA